MTTMRDAALAYAAEGWRVFPCHTPLLGTPTTCDCRNPACNQIGKHPRTKNGFQDASSDPATIERWWAMWPRANIGGVPGSAGVIAFDLDSDQAITAARELGLFAEPTFEVRTGNGVHRYYRHPPLPSGANIAGIVVRSMHGYVLLPPSLHASGRRYEIADSTPAIPLPPLALEAATQATSAVGARQRVELAVHATDIAPGDRHAALLALAGSLASRSVPIEMAAELVRSHNAARCRPPKPDAEVDNIVRFAYEKEQQKHAEVARHLIVAHAPGPQLVRPATAPPAPNPLEQPLPGVLETVAQWALETAPHPVRTYAVAAALGLASVVCARRYATTRQNYSTLYFLVIGTSGTGKEHVRRAITAILRAADATHLIGPNEWTSRSAVWSSVLQQPQSLAIIDEFGQFLGAASGGSDGATMKNGVLTALMELFSRVDDVALTPQFATLTLSEKQRKAIQRKAIERPALSVIGLTTPNEWYASLKGSRISSGFLNRFLVLEAQTSRGDLADPVDAPPPAVILNWVRSVLTPHADLDLPNRVEHLPAPKSLVIHPEAMERFRAFKRECNARADVLEGEQLGELPMRAAEQAMRLAILSALALDPHATEIGPQDATWAIAVTSYQLQQLIPAVQERVAESPVHALRNRFLSALQHEGERGLTSREILRHPVFRSVAKRERDEVVQWVQEAGYAGWGDVPHGPSGGRPRFALRVLTHVATLEAA